MSIQLFDDEELEFNEDENFDDFNNFLEEEIDDEEKDIRKPIKDKILDNDYNTGNLDFEEYDLPRVEESYASVNLSDCYDMYEYNRKLNLEQLIDEYFKNTEYGKIFADKKKLPKQSMPIVYCSIKEQFKGHEYSCSEIFTNISDYFGINYEVLYENIPSLLRQEIVKELDDKYHVLKKRGVKRLF
jgi:hypothetical protein